MEHKQTIVLRKDLNMRKGKMIAQGAHASMRAILMLFMNPPIRKIVNSRAIATDVAPILRRELEGVVLRDE